MYTTDIRRIKKRGCNLEMHNCKSVDEISSTARLLLHYHNKLDHMGFDKLKELARAGYLPHKMTKAEQVTRAACQIGKAHLTPADKSSSVIKNKNE